MTAALPASADCDPTWHPTTTPDSHTPTPWDCRIAEIADSRNQAAAVIDLYRAHTIQPTKEYL